MNRTGKHPRIEKSLRCVSAVLLSVFFVVIYYLGMHSTPVHTGERESWLLSVLGEFYREHGLYAAFVPGVLILFVALAPRSRWNRRVLNVLTLGWVVGYLLLAAVFALTLIE